jgi:lipopolysaccharide transport system permease protein
MKKPIVITPPKLIELPNFRAVWEYKDLLYLLVRRDLKNRFQQTFIGVLWIVLQPLLQMLIFYIIMGLLVRVPTGDVPYPVFYLSGYIVWQVFQQIINGSAYSLIGNIGIITKTYFPRLVLPLSSAIGAVIDFVISFVILLIFLLSNGYSMSARYLLLPFLLILTLVFSLGIGLIFGALMVVFRDTKNLLGFVLQIWMFMTPIMYPTSIAPEEFKFIFYINPLTGLVQAFRWVFLRSATLPSIGYFLLSGLSALVLIVIGMIVFRKMETRVADVM